MKKYWIFLASFMLWACSDKNNPPVEEPKPEEEQPEETVLEPFKANRLLIKHGIQLQCWVATDNFELGSAAGQPAYEMLPSDWALTGFTGPTFFGPPLINTSYFESFPDSQWAIAKAPHGDQLKKEPTDYEEKNGYLSEEQMAHIDKLTTVCFGDEEAYQYENVRKLKAWYDLSRRLYPDVLVHNNQYANQWSVSDMRTYIREAKPDLLTYDWYYFHTSDPNNYIGARDMADDLYTYRKLALEGWNGDKSDYLAFGQYIQGYVNEGTYKITESQLRLYYYLTWTFGGKWVNWFRYLQGDGYGGQTAQTEWALLLEKGQPGHPTKYMDWVTPDKIKFNIAKYFVDKDCYRVYNLIDYPIQVGNAWAAPFFLLDRTKVIMKFNPMPRLDSEKQIDKAIMEMESKLAKSGRSSTQIDLQTHLDTLKELLVSLKNNNQQLYNVNTYIVTEDAAKKEVRAMLKQQGFRYSEMFSRQVDGFISSNISRLDTMKSTMRGIPTSTLAASFPFISNSLQDYNGIYLGDNEYPVFVDFFKRDRERVNSNMMIIGKSGSGKSYATKTLLTNLAADNCKIFILDPENEYRDLTRNLGGKFIDVGSSLQGIINPFHVITSLDASEDEKEEYDENGELIVEEKKVDDSFTQHLQFLEQFFRVILEGINADAFEVLNSLVIDMYKKKGITYKTNLSKFKPEDYPIFDDLYNLILERLKTAKDDFSIRNLMTVETYIKKFATGGRNSALWNGPTSIETNENFVTFNFQSLVAGNNPTVTNAQMLLVFRYLNNEIINNKDFNQKYHKNRKIIVAVDEAHIFINPKYPIALDFMAQMAKRIRKYGGMQIVITQNLADFVGSDEIKRQSTAVINACQYSLIFSLAPNDVNDLIELYKKSGGINEEEQNSIVTAGVGQAFLITGPTSRTTVQVIAHDYVKQLFGG